MVLVDYIGIFFTFPNTFDIGIIVFIVLIDILYRIEK